MTWEPTGKAIELAKLIRKGRLSAVEATQAAIARIEKLDSQINAVVVRDFESALKQAKNLDSNFSKLDKKKQPLFGVPVTVKESYHLKEHPTTWGNPAWKKFKLEKDAVLVDYLRQSGAIILGKTNVPVNLADWQTFNPIYGTTNNPYDISKIPGGSSGGAAAALAAGLSNLEIGSDIGGSIRGPAHFCGVFGLKATLGLVSAVGHAKPNEFADPDIGAFGPLARYSDDLSLGFDITLGPDQIRHPRLINSRKEVIERRLDKNVKHWRIGVLLDSKSAPVDNAIQEKIMQVMQNLSECGAKVSIGGPSFDHKQVHQLFIHLLRAATSDGLTDQAYEIMQKKYQKIKNLKDTTNYDYERWLIQGSTMTHRDWLYANEKRAKYWQKWQSWFDEYDVLICPVASFPAFTHNQVGQRWERMIQVNGKDQPSTQTMFWAGLGGVFGMPGLSVPAGQTADGLPIGIQLYGNHYSEPKLIALAQLLEKEFDCQYHPPAMAL